MPLPLSNKRENSTIRKGHFLAHIFSLCSLRYWIQKSLCQVTQNWYYNFLLAFPFLAVQLQLRSGQYHQIQISTCLSFASLRDREQPNVEQLCSPSVQQLLQQKYFSTHGFLSMQYSFACKRQTADFSRLTPYCCFLC